MKTWGMICLVAILAGCSKSNQQVNHYQHAGVSLEAPKGWLITSTDSLASRSHTIQMQNTRKGYDAFMQINWLTEKTKLKDWIEEKAQEMKSQKENAGFAVKINPTVEALAKTRPIRPAMSITYEVKKEGSHRVGTIKAFEVKGRPVAIHQEGDVSIQEVMESDLTIIEQSIEVAGEAPPLDRLPFKLGPKEEQPKTKNEW